MGLSFLSKGLSLLEDIFNIPATFNDDVALKFGTGGTAQILYETADANANASIFVAPEGGGTDVPAFIFGDASILNADLGWFDGLTTPSIVVVNDAKDAYVRIDAGDDVIGGTRGIYFKTAADEDIRILSLSVTGTPQLSWDESWDGFVSNIAIQIQGGIYSQPASGSDASIRSISQGDGITSSIFGIRYSGDTGCAQLKLQKARGAIGSEVLPNDGDFSGSIIFFGWDGAGFEESAEIICAFDGTPAADDMPGWMSFRTTPSGSVSPTEHMVIRADGHIIFGNWNGSQVSSVATPYLFDAMAETYSTATDWARVWVDSTNAVTITDAAVPILASLYIEEPNITIGAGGAVATAVSLYIKSAPSEGSTNNWALYADAGDIVTDGDIRCAYARATSGFIAGSDGAALQSPNADNNYLLFKTRDNGVGVVEVARLAGAANPYWQIGRDDTGVATNAVTDGLVLQMGAGTNNEAANFGFGISVKLGNDASEVEERLSLDSVLTTATNGSEAAEWQFNAMNAGAMVNGILRVGTLGIGFYNTAPVAQQTGVAVSAAGIHAALVNLGLITA